MSDPLSLRDLLRARRTAKGLTVAACAERIGCPAAEWQAWEAGTDEPTAAQLLGPHDEPGGSSICRVLGISLAELLRHPVA
jgi:transcriptional regulator with XRE-family HTH domain